MNRVIKKHRSFPMLALVSKRVDEMICISCQFLLRKCRLETTEKADTRYAIAKLAPAENALVKRSPAAIPEMRPG